MMQGSNLNDIRESFESARSAKGRSSILNNTGANAAPSSGQPNDNFEQKPRGSARHYKEPHVRDNDLSDVVSLQMPDGSTYEGQYQEGEWHGHGKWTHPEGATYEGQYQEGKRHGHGKLTAVNGHITEGIWDNDKPPKH